MYQNYIAVDWAQANMAVARLTPEAKKATVMNVPSDIRQLKEYLITLRGKTVLTFEETTTAHWLFVELKGVVDEIIICDPYKNKLLSHGPKTDKIDAEKLALLLRGGFLKPVYHACNELIDLRKLVSAYDDLVKRGVRLKNQKNAIYRGLGLKSSDQMPSEKIIETFVLQNISNAIEQYEQDKSAYEDRFEKYSTKSTMIKCLRQIPGIGLIGSIKLAAAVVDGARFPDDHHFHSYCGLVRLEKLSGGRSYGSNQSRFRRDIKCVFKTAALAAIAHESEFKDYYRYLTQTKRLPDHDARHAVARKIATAVYGVMKNKTKYNPTKLGVLRHLAK